MTTVVRDRRARIDRPQPENLCGNRNYGKSDRRHHRRHEGPFLSLGRRPFLPPLMSGWVGWTLWSPCPAVRGPPYTVPPSTCSGPGPPGHQSRRTPVWVSTPVESSSVPLPSSVSGNDGVESCLHESRVPDHTGLYVGTVVAEPWVYRTTHVTKEVWGIDSSVRRDRGQSGNGLPL